MPIPKSHASTLVSAGSPRGRPAFSAACAAPLAELASRGELRPEFWREEFDWLLRQQVIGPVIPAPASAPIPEPASLAGQYAVRFAPVTVSRAGLEQNLAALAAWIAPALAAGHAVCVDLTTALLRGVCPRSLVIGLEWLLPAALRACGATTRGLSFSFRPACHADLALLSLGASAALGRPAVFVRAGDALLERLGIRDAAGESLWRRLTRRCYAGSGFGLLPATLNRSLSDLCAGETQDAVLPLSRLEAAAETGWLTFAIHLDRLAVADTLGGARAERLVRATLRFADNLLECVAWPTPALRRDAADQRRLAIQVTGAGLLVDRLGLDPAAFASLERVAAWFATLNRLMRRESARLAQHRGSFRGLRTAPLVRTLARRYGAQRARALIGPRSLRHRQLLVYSPFSLLPAGAPRHAPGAYLHLLPALREADALGVHDDEGRYLLSMAEYRRLLRMCWAVARNRR